MRPSDAGSAIVEFCFLGVLLMVPLCYALLTVFSVQSAAYAAAAATREAGRAFTTSAGAAGADADARAFQAARVAMRDHGWELKPSELWLDCSASPCLTPGGSVTASVSVQVPLPLLPPLFDRVAPSSVRVQAHHLEYVDRFRSAG